MRLEGSHVTVRIDRTEIITDISVVAEAGNVVGIVGANGSGKSTLIRALTRLLKPVAGQVLLHGRDIWKDYSAKEFAQNVAVLRQERDEDFGLIVEEVVTAGRTPHLQVLGRLTSKDWTIIQDAVEKAGIKNLINRKFDTLSGGEKQRVLLARVLAQQPRVIVLDEPTNHLDIKAQFDLLDLVKMTDATVFMAIHDLTLAMRYCDFLYVLKSGCLVASGVPREVLQSKNIEHAFGVQSSVVDAEDLGISTIAFAPRTDGNCG